MYQFTTKYGDVNKAKYVFFHTQKVKYVIFVNIPVFINVTEIFPVKFDGNSEFFLFLNDARAE
jgi:hypothetical protein